MKPAILSTLGCLWLGAAHAQEAEAPEAVDDPLPSTEAETPVAETPAEDGGETAIGRDETGEEPPLEPTSELPWDGPGSPDADPTPPPGAFPTGPGVEEPEPEPLAVPGLEKKRSSRRIYPRKLYRDRSEPHTCDVRAVLDDRGRPVEIQPDGCVDEPLYEHTVKRVLKDRWVKPTPPGAVVPVSVTYVPPVDAMGYPEASYFRRRDGVVCRAHVEIEMDGSASIARSEGRCGLVLDTLPATPEAVPRGPVPEVCTLTFLAKDGAATEIERFRCGLHLWKPSLAVVRALQWPHSADRSAGPQPWSVILQFDGPTAAE